MKDYARDSVSCTVRHTNIYISAADMAGCCSSSIQLTALQNIVALCIVSRLFGAKYFIVVLNPLNYTQRMNFKNISDLLVVVVWYFSLYLSLRSSRFIR